MKVGDLVRITTHLRDEGEEWITHILYSKWVGRGSGRGKCRCVGKITLRDYGVVIGTQECSLGSSPGVRILTSSGSIGWINVNSLEVLSS